MAIPILKRNAPISVNLNDADRENVAKILAADNIEETVSNSTFLRHCIEKAAKATVVEEEETPPPAPTVDTVEIIDGLKNKLATKTKELEQLLEAQKNTPTKTVEVPVFSHEGKVAIPITEKMEKALLIRQKRGVSDSMAHMCSQAVKYCIKYPLAELFTGRW
jgi:hypothetical protein